MYQEERRKEKGVEQDRWPTYIVQQFGQARMELNIALESALVPTMRVELIGHFQPCMTEIYLHTDARMADYIRTHP